MELIMGKECKEMGTRELIKALSCLKKIDLNATLTMVTKHPHLHPSTNQHMPSQQLTMTTAKDQAKLRKAKNLTISLMNTNVKTTSAQ